MNPWKVDFAELYQRHLCRHSQHALNVWHLVAVVGVYVALIGLLWSLPGGKWGAAVALVIYWLVLARNIPGRVLLLVCLVLAFMFAGFYFAPRLPIWGYALLAIASHRFQVWQHRVYDHHRDMSAFSDKYRKGVALAILLAVYELPILVQFLLRARGDASEVASETSA